MAGSAQVGRWNGINIRPGGPEDSRRVGPAATVSRRKGDKNGRPADSRAWAGDSGIRLGDAALTRGWGSGARRFMTIKRAAVFLSNLVAIDITSLGAGFCCQAS
jgi:hypothetical protein